MSSATGQATPNIPLIVTVTVNPASLSSGTYTGQVTVQAGAQVQTILVTMTINALNQATLLSQGGLSFTGVNQGGVVPPQTFAVLNIESGTSIGACRRPLWRVDRAG